MSDRDVDPRDLVLGLPGNRERELGNEPANWLEWSAVENGARIDGQWICMPAVETEPDTAPERAREGE